MEIRLLHDADGQPHIWSHGVSEKEVREAFFRRAEDRPSRGDSRAAIGHTVAGRILRLIYVPDAGGQSVFVITAYEVKGKPLSAYNRRRRRKGR